MEVPPNTIQAKDTEKTTTNDTIKVEEPPVKTEGMPNGKIPKKRGRKPKYPPESRKFMIHSTPITITFD
jgi:hypothetical protein